MKIKFNLLLLITTTLTYGQTLNFEIGRPFNEFRTLENKLNSRFQENKATHMLPADMAQPIAYLRTGDNFDPQPIIRYFFKSTDSTVQKIEYEWDKQNFRERNYHLTDKDFEGEERFKAFVKKYEDLRTEITNKFGVSKADGSFEPKSGVNYKEVQIRDTWNNDSLSIIMYMTFINRYEDNGSIKFPPAHRIRVYVNSKIDGNNADISSQLKTVFKVDEKQQKTAEKYINLLLTGKFRESWKLISPDVKAKTTFEDYLKAVEPIEKLKNDFGKEIELALSGPKYFNSETYYSYSFKFKSDKSSPPTVFLDVTFKLSGELIMGFQPKKLETRMN
jgi:hypothetical protein